MATYQLPFTGDTIKSELQQLVNNKFDNIMKASSPNASSDTNDVATTQWVKAETEAELDNYYTKAEIEAKIVEYDGEVISENEIRNLPQLNALWHRGIMGVESCILDYGEKLAPMIISGDNQHIRILNGVGMMQGRFFRVKDYDTIAIPNGAQNYNRIDLVCAKITQNENGTQTFSWEVVQGTQTTGTPTPPTVEEHSLDDGDEFALMPIASVELEGVNIVAVETVAEISQTVKKIESYIKRKGYTISSRSWPVGATWLSTLNLKPVADEGYEIIGILGYTANNNSVLFTNMYYDVVNQRLNGFVRNTATSAITDYIYVELLERRI